MKGPRRPSAAFLAGFGLLALGGFLTIRMLGKALRPFSIKATHGSLGMLRSALSIYYSDLEGLYPEGLAELTAGGKYLDRIPAAKTMDHSDSSEVTYFPSVAPMDSGAWGYVNNPYSNESGSVFVDCTHTDFSGKKWFLY